MGADDRCSTGSWSSARIVGAGGRMRQLHTARFPSMASAGYLKILVGTDLQMRSLAIPPGPTLSAWAMPGGRLLSPPPGEFSFKFPRVFSDGKHFHLLWGEPLYGRPEDVAGWMTGRIGSLWTASLDSAGAWSSPVRVYEGQVQWSASVPDREIVDPRGRVHLVTALPLDNDPGLLHLVFDGRDWVSQIVHTSTGPVAYASVAWSTTGPVIGLIASRNGAGFDHNSVFVFRSQDSGQSWLPPRVIRASGSEPAFGVKVRTGPHGIHLVWSVARDGGDGALQHTFSPDGGLTWSPTVDVTRGLVWPSFDYQVDECGVAHLVSAGLAADRRTGAFGYFEWAGRWKETRASLFPDLDVADPVLDRSSNNEITLAFIGRSAKDTSASFSAMISSLNGRVRP